MSGTWLLEPPPEPPPPPPRPAPPKPRIDYPVAVIKLVAFTVLALALWLIWWAWLLMRARGA